MINKLIKKNQFYSKLHNLEGFRKKLKGKYCSQIKVQKQNSI